MSGAAAKSSARRRRHGLPAEVTSFIGRRHEVAEVKRLLSGSRLVTLTGVGGVGKSRLAWRVGTELRRAFPDGVWLADLSAVDGPEQLVRVVAEALELPAAAAPTVDTLVDHVRDTWMLLILDNCERALHDCTVLTETLLRSAPRLRILATSRQALGAAGEHLLAVPPLCPPDSDGPPPSGRATPDEAAQLFAERARAVLPGFAITEHNRETVEAVCRRLDGVPLEIELAAARLRALSTEQLLSRLDDPFRLLTSRSPAVPPRHRTLRALIDWSSALCTDQERLLWARISVFSVSLDLEAAEAICSGDGIAREEIIDLVTGLVAKSVLIREEHPSGARYRLLESIRAYGRELLAATGKQEAVRTRHRNYYRGLSAGARTQRFTAGHVALLIRLELEHANVHAVLQQCLADPGQASDGLSMATDLLDHWIAGARLAEGRHWLERGLALHTEPDDVRAWALLANGRLAIIQADTGCAEAMVEQGRTPARRPGRELLAGHIDLDSAVIRLYLGDTAAGVSRCESAVTRLRPMGDPAALTAALIHLSLAQCVQGDVQRAVGTAEEALAICESHEERRYRAHAATTLAIATWRMGDLARAPELASESLRFHRLSADRLGTGINLEVLAWIAAAQGRHQRAAQLLGSAQALAETIGAPLFGFRYLASYHDECEAVTRTALGVPSFRKALKQGAGLSYEAAIGHALKERRERAERPSEETTKPSSPLTRRETEIALLVAQGLSNKEIAAALTIAQRTAEGHIEHILSKLGFNSRTQVALWVSERRLGEGNADAGKPDAVGT